jgi:hypothetical protein
MAYSNVGVVWTLEHSNENFLFGHARAKIMQLLLLSETAANYKNYEMIRQPSDVWYE